MTLPVGQSEKINIITDDLINYAFGDHINEDDRMLIASMMMVTARMIYLQKMGTNGKTMFENDKAVIFQEITPTVH
tara:strand:+ start:537 stop:764 length:228 start_codon:yes stop_codon:yes gene_type:complete